MWEATHTGETKMKLAITGIQLSMFDRLNNNYNTDFSAETGILTVSQPNLGPKSLDITSDDIGQFAGVLADFDPKVSAGLSLIETVEKTLEQGEEFVTFRTSMAKGARTVKIPVGEWPDFVRWWGAAAETAPDLIIQYRKMLAETEAKAEAVKAEKKGK
jgi:hypothetical protein